MITRASLTWLCCAYKHWRDVTFHSIPGCGCKLEQLDGKIDNLEPPLMLPGVVVPLSM